MTLTTASLTRLASFASLCSLNVLDDRHRQDPPSGPTLPLASSLPLPFSPRLPVMATFLNPWASEFRADLVEQDESLANLHISVQRLGLSWIESYLEAVFDTQQGNDKP